MRTIHRTALGALVLLTLLSLARVAGAATILPFQTTETGTYLLSVTSATTSHAVAVGTGSGSFGSFQSSGSQDSDFSDPLHQVVSNGHFTQDYGGGTTLFGTFSGTATATSSTAGTFALTIPFIGGTGGLSRIVGGGGTATGTFQLLSTNPDQTENLAYTLMLVGSVTVPAPWSLAMLIGGVTTLALLGRRRSRVGANCPAGAQGDVLESPRSVRE
jgi:hypothetical protein